MEVYLCQSAGGGGGGGGLDRRCCLAVIYDNRYILIGRESVFRLVEAEAQTFVYITEVEMIPSSSIYPSAESLK